MRPKLWLLLGVALMMVLGGSIGTFALFNSTAAPSDNDFTTGTLTLNSYRDQGDSVPGPMFYTTAAEGKTTTTGDPGLKPTGYWAPGDTNHRVLMVKNTGSLDAWLISVRAAMDASTSRHLADKLQVKVTTDSAGTNVIASGTMGQFIDGDQTFTPKVALNHGPTPKALHFWVSLPLDADNTYKNETLRVDFTVNAVQKNNNP